MERQNMRRTTFVALSCLLIGTRIVLAGDDLFDSVGLRAGFSSHRPSDRFYQVEVYGIDRLPWEADLGPRWKLHSQLEVTGGLLTGRGETGFIGSVGPDLLLEHQNRLLRLVAGFSPTIMDRPTFGNKQLGSTTQFTSHIGFYVRLGRLVDVGVRVQHMSNGGINGDHNPGMNNLMFSIDRCF